MPKASAVFTARELARLAGYELHPVDAGGVREREVRLAGVRVCFLEVGPDAREAEIAALVRRSGRLPADARLAKVSSKTPSRK